MSDNWPADAPNPKTHKYRLYWAASTRADIAAYSFKARYGQEPEWIIEQKPWLYLGPVPEPKEGT